MKRSKSIKKSAQTAKYFGLRETDVQFILCVSDGIAFFQMSTKVCLSSLYERYNVYTYDGIHDE